MKRLNTIVLAFLFVGWSESYKYFVHDFAVVPFCLPFKSGQIALSNVMPAEGCTRGYNTLTTLLSNGTIFLDQFQGPKCTELTYRSVYQQNECNRDYSILADWTRVQNEFPRTGYLDIIQTYYSNADCTGDVLYWEVDWKERVYNWNVTLGECKFGKIASSGANFKPNPPSPAENLDRKVIEIN